VELIGVQLTVNVTKLAHPTPTVMVNPASRIWRVAAEEEVHPTLLLLAHHHLEVPEAFLPSSTKTASTAPSARAESTDTQLCTAI